MSARKRRQPGGNGNNQRLVLADAGMLAGYRRAQPSLAQLDAAVADLSLAEDVVVVVMADAAMKRDLDASEQEQFEIYRSNGAVVCAAAGTVGGHSGFMRAAAERAAAKGTFADVLVLTARDIGRGPWTLVRLTREGDRWAIAPPDPTRAA